MKVDAQRLIITRQLPKTGQSVQYRVGDDGHYEAGWWLRRLIANNKTRFLLKTIGTDKVTLDRTTGLMWASDGNEAGCLETDSLEWNDSILDSYNLTFAGYLDWRCPNIFELLSIANYSKPTLCIDTTSFPNTQEDIYWTSTTDPNLTTKAFAVSFSTGLVYTDTKDTEHYTRCVRGGL